MKVRANTMIVGLGFQYDQGQEVEQETFAEKVGSGWRALCEPSDGKPVERAVTVPAAERRRGRR